MHILHTESSTGWGGQEIRILREAEGMRNRGHTIYFAVQKGARLALKAREKGFEVLELSFRRRFAIFSIFQLYQYIEEKQIDLVNTHSSKDAWIGGSAARLKGKKVIRTRHLSTPIKAGLNSVLLYNKLADFVVTTSSSIIPMIAKQAKRDPKDCKCIATGVDPAQIAASEESVRNFRKNLGVKEDDLLVGTACVVRSWKGIPDLIQAAKLLEKEKDIHFVIIGGGYLHHYRPLVMRYGLENKVHFTGHIDAPYFAIKALDIFLLLSSAHEGISQATLQAAFLKRPLITTSVGGLPEVCLDQKTGIIVPPHSPEKIAEAILRLKQDPELRSEMGRLGKELVEKKFTGKHMLDQMEEIYKQVTHAQ